MAKYTELKQYIEKEVKAKQFLTDSLSTISDIETLDNTKGELEDAVAKLKNDYKKASDKLDAMNQSVQDASDKIDEHVDTGKQIVDDAKAQAEGIIKQANRDAANIVAAAKDDLATLRANVKDYKAQADAAQEILAGFNGDVENIKAEKAKLLGKYGD